MSALPYDETIGDAICEAIADGESLRAICGADSMPARSTVFKWLSVTPAFADQYARAREAQAEMLADQLIEIADDSQGDVVVDDDGVVRTNAERVARSKLRIDTRKWIASKLLPRKYGEFARTEITGQDGGPVKMLVQATPSDERL